MIVSDPIADMLTRIRNANMAEKVSVEVPSSKIKIEIAKLLKSEGFVSDYSIIKRDENKSSLAINLKYTADREPVIQGLQRVSKPSFRVYAGKDQLPSVNMGLGLAIISTSKGLMSSEMARKQGLGGEIVAEIY